MTGKERAALRAQANTLKPLFQVGKDGVNDGVIKQARSAIQKNELIKLKVLLESCPETPREAADKLALALGAEVIQVIGGSMIFYKYNPELHKPAKKPAAKKPAGKRSGFGKMKIKAMRSGSGYGKREGSGYSKKFGGRNG